MGRTPTRRRAISVPRSKSALAHAMTGERGDIVEIEWYDTHSSGRMTLREAEDLDEPKATLAFGIVMRSGPRYLTIASEFCTDPLSDGTWIEQIPHGSIIGIRRLGRRDLGRLLGKGASSDMA